MCASNCMALEALNYKKMKNCSIHDSAVTAREREGSQVREKNVGF